VALAPLLLLHPQYNKPPSKVIKPENKEIKPVAWSNGQNLIKYNFAPSTVRLLLRLACPLLPTALLAGPPVQGTG
jgi:hypothetical protein